MCPASLKVGGHSNHCRRKDEHIDTLPLPAADVVRELPTLIPAADPGAAAALVPNKCGNRSGTFALGNNPTCRAVESYTGRGRTSYTLLTPLLPLVPAPAVVSADDNDVVSVVIADPNRTRLVLRANNCICCSSVRTSNLDTRRRTCSWKPPSVYPDNLSTVTGVVPIAVIAGSIVASRDCSEYTPTDESSLLTADFCSDAAAGADTANGAWAGRPSSERI